MSVVSVHALRHAANTPKRDLLQSLPSRSLIRKLSKNHIVAFSASKPIGVATSGYNFLFMFFARRFQMKYRFFAALLAIALAALASTCAAGQSSNTQHEDSGQQDSNDKPLTSAPAVPASIPPDQRSAYQARQLIEQGIRALGGDAYLNIRNLEEQGRIYSFHHGNPTSNGVFFWRFTEFPDKERIELTPQRDIAYVYTGDKGYELTYKGTRPIEKKDFDDYQRRHHFSLETVLRSWVNDPKVALFFDGDALAGTLAAQKVTLINAQNEAVSLYFDIDTHLPIRKSYSWRDPADREKNTEEESYDNYRLIQGLMTCFNFTRYYNGDMQSERFVNSASYNQTLDETMFDPKSGYNPTKLAKKH
jgi:hypothetical protein